MHLVDCLYCSFTFILKLTLQHLSNVHTWKPAQIFPFNAALGLLKRAEII